MGSKINFQTDTFQFISVKSKANQEQCKGLSHRSADVMVILLQGHKNKDMTVCSGEILPI